MALCCCAVTVLCCAVLMLWTEPKPKPHGLIRCFDAPFFKWLEPFQGYNDEEIRTLK